MKKQERKTVCHIEICGRLVCLCFRVLPTPTIEDRLSVTFILVCAYMKKVEQINDTALITEILASMVCEKSGLVWVVPFSAEVQEQVLYELFSKFQISEN